LILFFLKFPVVLPNCPLNGEPFSRCQIKILATSIGQTSSGSRPRMNQDGSLETQAGSRAFSLPLAGVGEVALYWVKGGFSTSCIKCIRILWYNNEKAEQLTGSASKLYGISKDEISALFPGDFSVPRLRLVPSGQAPEDPDDQTRGSTVAPRA
jgi:hypothetical protein